MLSIGAMHQDSGEYYMELAREDYYLGGGEPPGRWLGQGAKTMGLTGQVEKDHFFYLLEGNAPDGIGQLVRTDSKQAHHPGWDLTFSAPKGVSVIWSQADQDLRQAIQECQQAAVAQAVAYLEAEAAITRRGKGGRIREPVDLVVATFEHGTSRAQDPQLHTHALVLNVAVREDGSYGALAGDLLYRHKMAAGAVYRAELSSQLQQRFGFEIEQHGRAFEVKGVPQSLIREFSQRRREIERSLADHGLSGAKAAAIAALETRHVKEHLPREVLLREWQAVGRRHSFSREQAMALVRAPRRVGKPKVEADAAARRAIDRITAGQAHFTARDLLRFTAEECQWLGVGAEEARAAARRALQNDEIVAVGSHRLETVYSTRSMLRIEQEMLKRAERSARSRQHVISKETVDRILKQHPELSEEQKRAIRHITQESGAMKLVDGLAGTGKTAMLKVARTIWEAGGFRVIGAAVSGKAARGLEEGAGIESTTMAGLRYQHDPEYRRRLGGKPEKGRRTPRASVTLDRRTVVVIDEASMMGTDDLAWLVAECERTGAKLNLNGDRAQLAAIQAGGGFAALGDQVGHAKLTDIRRQRDQWARDAVKAMAAGDVDKALRAYADRGLVELAKDRQGARQRLLASWRRQGVERPQDHVIFSATRNETRLLNRAAQQARLQAGKLGNVAVQVGDQELRAGDRVLFTKRSPTFKVENGSTGTVAMVEPGRRQVVVDVDGGRRVVLPLERYSDLELGYAMTTHKGQGMTVEHAYLLMGGPMQDREMAYVQMSRARGETRLFVNEAEGGDDFGDLRRQLKTSRTKELATTVGRRRVSADETTPQPEARIRPPDIEL